MSKNKNLGNPAAMATVASNPDVMKLATGVIKWTLIGVAGTIAFFVIKKQVTKALENRRARKAEAEETKAVEKTINKNNVTLSADTLRKMVADIYDAFHPTLDDDYQEEKIEAVLKKLKTPDDWKKLQTEFGSKKCKAEDNKLLNLKSFLGRDGWWDRSNYNKILQSIGVEDDELITSYS